MPTNASARTTALRVWTHEIPALLAKINLWSDLYTNGSIVEDCINRTATDVTDNFAGPLTRKLQISNRKGEA